MITFTFDLSPSMHWPAPVLSRDIEGDRGPVLVTIEYRIRPEHRDARRSRSSRRSGGATARSTGASSRMSRRQGVSSKPSRWTSAQHLRQHERVTNADRVLQEAVHRFDVARAPKVHASDRGPTPRNGLLHRDLT